LGTHSSEKLEVQKRLEDELERLTHITHFGHTLEVRWIPNDASTLAGEVRGNVVFIYESDCEKAITTLRHEVIDCIVSRAIEPYRGVTNSLIKMINQNAYQRKEQVVEALTRLIETISD
jgi:hypothetical protein